ncbi:MAG: hypothetical protein OXF02_04435, partial [Simkaniaceae bacterium]|nr:hypothetical protein [Simkaniaceae bacterium]
GVSRRIRDECETYPEVATVEPDVYSGKIADYGGLLVELRQWSGKRSIRLSDHFITLRALSAGGVLIGSVSPDGGAVSRRASLFSFGRERGKTNLYRRSKEKDGELLALRASRGPGIAE